MKRLTCITLLLITLLSLSSCASMRRHPVLYGITIGAGTAVIIGVATHKSCPHTINGVAYDGTPPCPKYWPPDEPGKK